MSEEYKKPILALGDAAKYDKMLFKAASLLDKDIKNLETVIKYRESRGLKSEELHTRIVALGEIKTNLRNTNHQEASIVFSAALVYSYVRLSIGISSVLFFYLFGYRRYMNLAKETKAELTKTQLKLKDAIFEDRGSSSSAFRFMKADSEEIEQITFRLGEVEKLSFQGNVDIFKSVVVFTAIALLLLALNTALTRMVIAFYADRVTEKKLDSAKPSMLIVNTYKKINRLLNY